MTDLLWSHARGPLRRAKRRFVRTLEFTSLRWTQSCPRTGGVLYAGGQYTAGKRGLCIVGGRKSLTTKEMKVHEGSARLV